ncbi:MAG: nucleotidyltransferase domain-containing protein [Burkholderiales bacterium]
MSVAIPLTNDLETVRAIVGRVLQGTDAKLILFGSRARGDARHWSDIDLAIQLAETSPHGVLSELRAAIEESNVLLNVDVVDLNEASPMLREAVAREGIPWIA